MKQRVAAFMARIARALGLKRMQAHCEAKARPETDSVVVAEQRCGRGITSDDLTPGVDPLEAGVTSDLKLV